MMAAPRRTVHLMKTIVAAGAEAEIDLETRRRILDAARQLFIAKGFKGVSMRDVAEVVKVTPAALYYHFPQGKEDLFIEVVKHMFDEYALGVRAAAKLGQNIREKLRLLALHIILQFGRESGPMLMRDVQQHLPAEKQPEIWKHFKLTYINTIQEVFQEGIDREEISPNVGPEILSNMFHGMTMSLNWNPRMRECMIEPVEAGRMADNIVSVLLDGIALKRR